jgi:tetratricopeptide (TPR) repeat protein
MDVKEKYVEETVDYLYNDLLEHEKVTFEELLNKNVDLTSEYQRQKEMVDGIYARLKYKEAMQDEHIDEARRLAEEVVAGRPMPKIEKQRAVNTKIRSLRYYFGASAAIILILIVAGMMFINPNPQNLYQKFYSPFSAANFTERTIEERDLQQEGIANYLNGDYSLAILSLAKLNQEQGLRAEASFILGLSYMETNKYNRAKETFSEYLNQNNHLQAEVKWYLGLCYLQVGEYSQAYSLFEELSSESGKFGLNARKLNRRLKKIAD